MCGRAAVTAGREAMAMVVTRRRHSLSSAVWGWASQLRRTTARIAGMAALQGAMEPLSIFLCPARRAPPASGATYSLSTPRHKLGFVAVASQLRFSLLLQCFGKLLVILGTLESGALLNIVEYNYFWFLFESGAPQAYVLN